MTDWRAVAVALQAPILDEDAGVITTLENLERSFRPLQEAIPFGVPPWTGPSEIE